MVTREETSAVEGGAGEGRRRLTGGSGILAENQPLHSSHSPSGISWGSPLGMCTPARGLR